MKIKIFYLVSDTNDGTKVELFGSAAEQLATQRRIIEEDIARAETNFEPLPTILAFIKDGKIEAAWDLWIQKFKDPMDTYDVSSQEVELSLDTPTLVGALVNSISLTKAEFYGTRFKVTVRKS